MSADSVDEQAFKALLQRVEELEEKVDELESGSNSKSKSRNVSGAGPRDQAVLDQLDVGEVVTVGNLRQLYQMHTDIRTKSTLKNRVRTITNRPEFEFVSPGKWRYIGGDDDE